MIELKPCPFCGSEAAIHSKQDEDLWSHDIVTWVSISCKSCEIGTEAWPISVADEQVFGVWNRRV